MEKCKAPAITHPPPETPTDTTPARIDTHIIKEIVYVPKPTTIIKTDTLTEKEIILKTDTLVIPEIVRYDSVYIYQDTIEEGPVTLDYGLLTGGPLIAFIPEITYEEQIKYIEKTIYKPKYLKTKFMLTPLLGIRSSDRFYLSYGGAVGYNNWQGTFLTDKEGSTIAVGYRIRF